MTASPGSAPQSPDGQEPCIRWHVWLGAIVVGAVAGAVPGTIMLAVISSLLGIGWTHVATPASICTAVGAFCGIFFPKATLAYGHAFLAACWP